MKMLDYEQVILQQVLGKSRIEFFTKSISFVELVGKKNNKYSAEYLSEPDVEVFFIFEFKKYGGSFTIITDGEKYCNVSYPSYNKDTDCYFYKQSRSSRQKGKNPNILDQIAIKAMIENWDGD